eukprot:COSAG02_NODE_478_length_21511_cov_120.811087_17_plen_84_part_00
MQDTRTITQATSSGLLSILSLLAKHCSGDSSSYVERNRQRSDWHLDRLVGGGGVAPVAYDRVQRNRTAELTSSKCSNAPSSNY